MWVDRNTTRTRVKGTIMSNNQKFEVGGVVRLINPYTADASNTVTTMSVAVEVGELFIVKEVSQDTVLVQHILNSNGTNVKVYMNINKTDLQVYPPEQEPDPPVNPEPPEEDMCEYRRYSLATISAVTKRPEVFLYQTTLTLAGSYTGVIDGWYGNGSAAATKDFQSKNELSADGVIGKGTATELIKQATAGGFEPALNLRIMSVIAFYEVSNRSDAFGMAENDIGDGAGANYGIFQCNSLGSVISMLNLAGRSDLVSVYNSTDKTKVNPTIKDWFGSSEGIATQIKYFDEKLLAIGMRQLREFEVFNAWENDPAMKKYWERAVLLFCDSVVQNGTMWSGSRKPFWKAIEEWEKSDPQGYKWPELFYGTWWNETLGKYIQYGEDNDSGMKGLWWKHYESHGGVDRSNLNADACKKANQSAAKEIVMGISNDPTAQLSVLAQFRSRSSSDKYWFQAVASRRITDATGSSSNHPEGVVNGAKIDLPCDYQL